MIERTIARFGVPTLILGNQQDPIHPWTIAETLAQLIPGAELREVTPKSVSRREALPPTSRRRWTAFFSSRFLESEVNPC